jgi:SAM-dependent methyltransferase
MLRAFVVPRTRAAFFRALEQLRMAQDSLSTWYSDFFTELPNAFWRAAVPPEATAAEVAFLVRTAGLAPGSRVIDVACGSGRHALELARRGFRVTGVDVSAEAIGFARAAADGLAVDLRVADMRELPADPRVDLAVCLGNAFGYLDHDGTVAFLADLFGLVVPGGTLVLDYAFVAEALLPGLSLVEEPMTIGGVEATQVNEYDTAESRWFDRVERFGDPDGSPFRLGSRRLLLVARRA